LIGRAGSVPWFFLQDADSDAPRATTESW